MSVNEASGFSLNDWIVIPQPVPLVANETSLGIFHETLAREKQNAYELHSSMSKCYNSSSLFPNQNSTLERTAKQFSLTMGYAIHRNWGRQLINEKKCFEKMGTNRKKAYWEHVAEDNQFLESQKLDRDDFPSPFLDPHAWGMNSSLSLGITDNDQTKTSKSGDDVSCGEAGIRARLSLHYGSAEAQGVRPSMEDAKIAVELEGGLLAGVFDGHGGKEVAEFVSREFPRRFPFELEIADGNVHRAFERSFLMLQEQINSKEEFDNVGSTAGVSYIDIKHRIVYTATLGDSEAFICRKDSQEAHKLIPLSCVKSWASEKDIQRASMSVDGEYIMPVALFWEKFNVPAKNRRIESKSKDLPLVNDMHGLNVSRAFGDRAKNKGRPSDAVITKPKITFCPVNEGDIILWFCDGLTDYVLDKRKINTCIDQHCSEAASKISYYLTKLALDQKSQDNVTVLTVKVGI